MRSCIPALKQPGFRIVNSYNSKLPLKKRLFVDFSLKDIVEKKIIVNKITYPISSMRRILKYSRQNFWMCPQQMEIFLTQTQKLGTLNNKVISVD